MDAHRKTIGRVAVDRAIRLRVDPSVVAAQPDPRASKASRDFVCARCGAVICPADRVKLFRGIVLKCTSCGEASRCTDGGAPLAGSGTG